jgi:hypothetical protein
MGQRSSRRRQKMASNNYNPYNYPYQQSSAQQYSVHQTAPPSNNPPQASRQYQSGTSQSADYMSYQTQSYGGQTNAYGGNQDNSWETGNNYGGNRGSTTIAAEVLRNMSNTGYTPNSAPAATQPGFTPTNAATTSRYSSNAQHTQQVQKPSQQSPYAQQARPRSVNTNRGQDSSSSTRGLTSPAMAVGYPSQRAGATYQQRSTSPAQPQYGQTQPSVSTARSEALTAATQYNDYNRRQLPNPATAVSTSYGYGDNQTASASQTAGNSESYNQSAITVDPMAVYDPWPEYQRKQEALQAQKAGEDATRAEDERIAEEARKEEERKKEQERKRQEEEERARQAQMNQSKRKNPQPQASGSADSGSASNAQDAPMSGEMEEQIRVLMAKMREFNSKDPALLARIWEEERRAKAPKSPTVQTNPAPQAPPATTPTQTPLANQRRKAAPKDAPVPKPATPAAVPAKATLIAAPASHSGGNTIWPPEKKSHLASAASTYLNTANPERHLEASEVLRMLDGNPSYIELCEQLEKMGLKLDRAAFAKNLLSAVPDVNSASRAKKPAPVPGPPVQRGVVAPPAVMKRNIGTPATPATGHASAPTPASFTAYPENNAPTPVREAEMISIKPEARLPANKEEAARKRTFNDLIDLLQMPEDEGFEPAPKKVNTGPMYSTAPTRPAAHDIMEIDDHSPANFPVPGHAAPEAVQPTRSPPVNELRYQTIVEPLDRKKALRRNNYNVATIARDVLLACGRHPETRQLNQHLEILKSTLPQISNEADLSTLRWDLIDPGRPPPGYFKDSVQALAEDADDEEDSDEESRQPVRWSSTYGLGEGTSQAKAQALPEAINPFKQQKRRGPRPRHSLPTDATTTTPNRPIPAPMSASAPRPTAAAGHVGYSAFRSATEYDADGKPLPKKRGRPVGWRKNIHGSAAAQARPAANGHTGPTRFIPAQPSLLRKSSTTNNEPIRIESRSPSVPNKAPRFQSFKCGWQGCKAELHNLETLKKHVHKVHLDRDSLQDSIQCLWGDCPKGVESHDPMTNTRIERFEAQMFYNFTDWHAHLEHTHFSPLSWQLGDGPASGLSGECSSPCT